MNLMYFLKMCKIYFLIKFLYWILIGYFFFFSLVIFIKLLYSNCCLVNFVLNFLEDRKWLGLMYLKYFEMCENLILCF